MDAQDVDISDRFGLDDGARAALVLLDPSARKKLLMKMILRGAEIKHPSGFVTRSAWNCLKGEPY